MAGPDCPPSTRNRSCVRVDGQKVTELAERVRHASNKSGPDDTPRLVEQRLARDLQRPRTDLECGAGDEWKPFSMPASKPTPAAQHLWTDTFDLPRTDLFNIEDNLAGRLATSLFAESLMAGAKGTAKLAFDLLVNAITLPEKAFSMAEGDSPIEEDAVREGARGL